MATIKPKPEPSAKTTEPEHKENRYVRAFNVLAADNTLPLDQIATKADIKERAARSMIDAWNAAIHALDARAALAVDPTTLIHDAPDAQSGSQRVIRVLVQEGTETDIAELAKRGNVSQATARRVLDMYRSVISAQSIVQDTRSAKGATEYNNNRSGNAGSSPGTSAMKAKAA